MSRGDARANERANGSIDDDVGWLVFDSCPIVNWNREFRRTVMQRALPPITNRGGRINVCYMQFGVLAEGRRFASHVVRCREGAMNWPGVSATLPHLESRKSSQE